MANRVWRGDAPGRLDFMGGVADYSGSLVLQTPISATTRVTVEELAESELQLTSEQESKVTLSLVWLSDLSTQPNSSWRAQLDDRQIPRWARYPLGCLLLFSQAQEWWPSHGLNIKVESGVPTSMGVSSSAALEVAALRALEDLSGLRFTGTDRAKLAQRVENEIVGAPCGLMDQLASSHGVARTLLPILCRPDALGAPIPLPTGVLVVGWPSGVKHDVADSPYATARTATFMGKKILEGALSKRLAYLTELAPSQISRFGDDVLPPTIIGEEFLARYEAVDDPLSVVDASRTYPLRAGASFPIEENFRCQLAAQLLETCADVNCTDARGVEAKRDEALRSVGELMYQSHRGYSSIGLGCDQTDVMVQAVQDLRPGQGFYGARVSGGGSGGTVVVLLKQSSLPKLQSLANRICGTSTQPWPLIQ